MLTSRRRALWIAAAVLLILDVSRSIYARIGATTPTRLWSPDPSYARPIAWPPGSDLPATAPLGQRVYAQHCAICHGPDGHGNGPAAPSLHPRPRDFSGGVFKLRSTSEADPPTLADVRATVRRGMPGTSMPGWSDILSDADIDAVADYIRSFGPHAAWAPIERVRAIAPSVLAAGSPVRGRTLFDDLGCPACHGKEGRGDGSSAKDLRDVWKQPASPRDLTAPWTFRGGDDPAALYTRIASGMSGTPMPGYAEVAEPQQIADVVAFVGSIARTPPWQPGGTLDGPGQATGLLQRGEYLVHAGMCGLCHTPVDANGIYLADTHYLAGGMKVEAGAHGIFFTRNLTSDHDTGLGTWTVEQIATAIRTGHAPDRRLNFWGMPWMVFGALTEEDGRAIATYLKTLPPVHNSVPMPLHYGFIETVVRKLGYSWPALIPERLAYYAGNFGYETPATVPRDLPQRVLIWVQLAVVVLSVIVWLFSPAREPSERGPRLRLIGTVVLVVAFAGLAIVYRYPAIDRLPSATVIDAFAASVPEVKADDGSAPQPMLERGRYLYRIASCPYCHNGNGAGGGKVNWHVLGTTWARNLTSHPTGLANWSDDAVLRAMVSGVSREGRALHWQGMLWDHISNYSIEDQRALLVYVRSLPPVDRAVPAAVPPGGHDCPGDTFWIGTSSVTSGCD